MRWRNRPDGDERALGGERLRHVVGDLAFIETPARLLAREGVQGLGRAPVTSIDVTFPRRLAVEQVVLRSRRRPSCQLGDANCASSPTPLEATGQPFSA